MLLGLLPLLLAVVLALGCAGETGGTDAQGTADTSGGEVLRPASPAAPDGGLDDPGTEAGEPRDETGDRLAEREGDPTRSAVPGDDYVPGGAPPEAEGDGDTDDAPEEGSSEDAGGDGEASLDVPEGFEDVAPIDDPPSPAELELNGPFTGGAEGQDGDEERAPEGDAAARLDSVTVYLVEAAETPPAAVRGSGAAGSGERRPTGPGAGEYAGSFGCGDDLVGLVRRFDEPRQVADAADHVRLALTSLLALERADVPSDLMNALRRSPLTVQSVGRVADRPGVMRVKLAGPLRLGGTCDAPRVRAQIYATALQVPGVEELEVFIGDEPLDALLSARGGVAP